MEISSYGRVKEGGSVIVPENTKYGFGTYIKGKKQTTNKTATNPNMEER